MAGVISLAQSVAQGFAVNSGLEMLGGAQRAVSYAANRALPNNSLGYDTYVRLFYANLLDSKGFQDNLYHLGFEVTLLPQPRFRLIKVGDSGLLELRSEIWQGDLTDVDRAVAISKNLPSPDETLLLLNRGLLSPALAQWLIKFNFGGETDLAKAWLTLKDQIPGPSDLVSFAVRDVWSPDIVTTFQYNKELPSAILPWMAKQGLAGSIDIPLPPGSTNTEGPDTRTTAQWFDAYWWAHWQLPSVGQGFTMLQRLYPDSRYGPSPYAGPESFFTQENLELLQKANDFPPYWRKRLQAIAYNPLTRVDIRRMYATGVLKEDKDNHDVYHAYRQIGYNDNDSLRLTTYTLRTARKDIKDLTIQQVTKLFKQGVLDQQQAIEALTKLFYTPEESGAYVSLLSLELSSEEITQLLKLAKRAFVEGDFNEDAVRALFARMGLTPTSQDRYIRLWVSEKVATPRHVSAAQAVKMYKMGLFNATALATRLTNLRYPPPEVNLIIEQANVDVQLQLAKAQLAGLKQQQRASTQAAKEKAKADTAAAKEKVKETESATKQVEKIRAKDKAAFSEKNIIAFYKGGFIDAEEVHNILAAKGWFENTIETWMATYTPPRKEMVSNGTTKSK